jgi:hypothetical protein
MRCAVNKGGNCQLRNHSGRRQLYTFLFALKTTRDIHCVSRPRCLRTRNVFRKLVQVSLPKLTPLYLLPLYVTEKDVANTILIKGTKYGGLSLSGFELCLKTRLLP